MSDIDVEALLRRALAPVDPPERLSARLESTLAELHGLAADELEAWELGAMRDPRNWVRPAAAMVVGSATTAALVVLRTRRRSKGRLATVRDVADEARRLIR